MSKYLFLLFLLIAYSIFAQKQYEIRGGGYWPIEQPLERYWIAKINKVKIVDPTDLDINSIFHFLEYEGNEGYYYSFTSIVDGAKVSAVYLIIDYVFS
jgi:hypothetical protein